MLCLHSHFLLNEIPHICARVFTPHSPTFSPSHHGVIRDTLFYDHSSIFLPRAPRSCVGIIYPQAFSTLARLHQYFYLRLRLSRLLLGQFFLEVCGTSFISSDYGHRPSVSLIHSLPQTVY